MASLDDIAKARTLVDRIYIDEKIIEYILDIVISTRPGKREALSSRQTNTDFSTIDGLISFGASPRASIALALAGQGMALLQGRSYVLQSLSVWPPDHSIWRCSVLPFKYYS